MLLVPYISAKSFMTTTTANFTQDRVSFQVPRELRYGQSVIRYLLLWRTMGAS